MKPLTWYDCIVKLESIEFTFFYVRKRIPNLSQTLYIKYLHGTIDNSKTNDTLWQFKHEVVCSVSQDIFLTNLTGFKTKRLKRLVASKHWYFKTMSSTSVIYYPL